jgi:2-polyprenyl-6-methoxyphenol hydroxylase-like FAD-dependent oxidoreductase
MPELSGTDWTEQVLAPIIVLIVGGGPIGLGIALELGWRGIESTLVEQGDGEIEHPRTGLMAVRTMELLRRWGLAQRIRDSGFPDDYELSMVFCTSLNGLLLAKEPYPSMRDMPTPPETREKKQRCPQLWMQPILAEAARRWRSGRTTCSLATAPPAPCAPGSALTCRGGYSATRSTS